MEKFDYRRLVEGFRDNVSDVYIDLENSTREARETVRCMDKLANAVFDYIKPTDTEYAEDGLYVIKGSKLNDLKIDLGVDPMDLIAKVVTAKDIHDQLVQDPSIPDFTDDDLTNITLSIYNGETKKYVAECFQIMIDEAKADFLTDILIEE
ncbi:MAG: hypothetical protein ACRC92_04125 [Peptostreptococcaceae bacterium]